MSHADIILFVVFMASPLLAYGLFGLLGDAINRNRNPPRVPMTIDELWNAVHEGRFPLTAEELRRVTEEHRCPKCHRMFTSRSADNPQRVVYRCSPCHLEIAIGLAKETP